MACAAVAVCLRFRRESEKYVAVKPTFQPSGFDCNNKPCDLRRNRKGKGTLVLHFNNEDELERPMHVCHTNISSANRFLIHSSERDIEIPFEPFIDDALGDLDKVVTLSQ